MMEVDFHPSVSPSRACGSPFGTLRHSKQNKMSKRGRSPEDTDADADRPLKRAACRHLQLSTVTSGNSSRQNSEDWVQQTGGLRIDSPVVPPSDAPYYLAGNVEAIGVAGPGPSTLAHMDEDIDMAEEPEIRPMDSTLPNHSNATPVYDSSDPFLQQLEKRRLLMLNMSRHPYGVWAQSSRVANPSGPMIHIVPATPAHSQQSLTLHENPARNGSTSTTSHAGRTQVMLQVQGERVATPPPPPPDDSGPAFQQGHAANYQVCGPKRRITFGPRLDCEKCQRGEIHFTHFDYQ